MAYVPVPKDLSKIKTKLAFNLTKRQLVCFSGAAAVGLPAYLLSRGSIGNSAAMFLMIGLMLPFFFLAMYERDGLPLEKVLKNIIRTRFLYPRVRPYKTENFYALLSARKEAQPIAKQQKGRKARRKEEPVVEVKAEKKEEKPVKVEKAAKVEKTEHAEKKEPVKTETKNEFKKEHKKEKDFKKAPKKEVREETELAKVEPATIEACEKFVEDVLNAMNMEEVKVTSTVDEEGALSITMEGKNMGILIGKRGQTLDSLQYLTNRVANKMQDGYVRVKLDTEDYRRRRKETLENLAKNIASKVKRTRRTVALEPMNPYERRIIHSALQSDPAVSTHSEGEEPYRKVVVTLARRSGGSHNYEKYDK